MSNPHDTSTTPIDSRVDDLVRQLHDAPADSRGEILETAERRAVARARLRLRMELAEVPTRGRGRRVFVLAIVAAFGVTGLAAANGDAIMNAFSPDTPASDRMEVFRKAPSISADPSSVTDPDQPIVPADVQARFDLNWELEPEFMANQYGQQNRGGSGRVLLDHHGDWDVAIYAVPTTKGACFEVSVGGQPGSSSCVAGFTQEAPVSIGISSSALHGKMTYQQIHGLAADEVTAVAVRLADGSDEAALMGDNAYVWRDETGRKEPTRLVVRLDGGAQTELPFPFARR